jgi:saccharopine dehydrogenase-like NADP-dependent oxidoreductase
VGGVRVRPLDVTAALLFPRWQLPAGEADLTVMQITVEGTRGGERLRYVHDLLDRYDPESGITSMARTTGYAATAAVRLVARGLYTRPGISPPEYLGRDRACVDFMLAAQADRGILYTETVETR